MALEFWFPESEEDLLKFREFSDLRNKLTEFKQIEKCDFSLRFSVHAGKYWYVRCGQCKWHLRYRFNAEEDCYILSHCQLRHSHLKESKKTQQLVQSFIRDLPLGMEQKYARTLTTNCFNIKDSMFYYYYRKVSVDLGSCNNDSPL